MEVCLLCWELRGGERPEREVRRLRNMVVLVAGSSRVVCVCG